MSDETANRPAGAPDGGGHPEGSRSEPAPLQSRAKFLQNWDWLSVTQINGGLCERSGAQRGVNSETHAAVAEEWETRRKRELSLLETFEFLKSCHKRAPFLFFNGNTFAEIGRALTNTLLRDLPLHRRKEAASAAAHFITGVLDRELMIQMINEMCETVEFQVDDEVQTLRGSMKGKIMRVLADGRVVWRAASGAELTALPESLIRRKKRRK
jgi:hypothetical protein